MKTAITTVLFFIAQFLNAQCTQNVSSFGNNQNVLNYNITGDVTVTLNSDQTVTLDLASNFETGEGPDIRAYLINSNGLSDTVIKSSLISSLENFEFGLIGSNSSIPEVPQNGAKSFTVPIPNGAVIENYDKVFFYCLEFNAFWDFGSFEPFSTSNCNVLSTPTFTADELSVFPNPVTEKLTITTKHLEPVTLKLYTLNGQLIRTFPMRTATNFQIDVSNFNSGVYLLEIESTNRIVHQRLLVN